MTFEQWWELHGNALLYELQSRPADCFSAIEATVRIACYTGWRAAESNRAGLAGSFEAAGPVSNARNKQSAFDAWLEMHEAECQEGRYYKKCFELCWNAALDAVEKEVPIPLNIAKSDAELLIRGLESLRVTE